MSGDEQRDDLAFIVHQAFLVTAPMTVVELAGYDQQVYETVLTRTADAILSSALLDRVKREAAAEAWDEAADAYWRDNTMPRNVKHYHRMRDRATAIRKGATS